MGQGFGTCECFEHMPSLLENTDEKVVNERLQQLVQGDNFTRSALLGFTSQEVNIHLTEDFSILKWKCTKKSWTGSEEFGEIDLTSQVKKLKTAGESSFQIISSNPLPASETVLMELKHTDSAIRDKWVIAINELLQSWIDSPDKKPKAQINASGTSNKAEYFKKREEEIKNRERERNEKKSKYASSGMPMTAQIMAGRSST